MRKNKAIDWKELKNNKVLIKKLRTAFVIAAVFVILFLLNVLANQLPWSYDMTVEKIFTLSEQTASVVKGLSDQVNIVAFFQDGGEDQMVKALLEEYQKLNKDVISIEYYDADRNPAIVKKYDANDEGISNGTVIFESNGTIKKINKSDIYLLNDYAYGKTFNGEQQFTGAIIYVTSEQLPKVYFLQGHREMDINSDLSSLKARLEGEAHMTDSLNILKSGSIPADTDVIIAASPKADLNNDETAKLEEYLTKGGRMIFLFDILAQGEQLPNFSSLLSEYGVSYTSNFVVEEESNSFYANNKMFLIPYYNINNIIVQKLNDENLFVLLPFSSSIQVSSELDRTVTVETLLATSKDAWIRYDMNDTTPEKTSADDAGPATLAVAVTKDNTDLRYDMTKIVVVGNAAFVQNDYIDTQGNFNFLLNSLNWVEDKDSSIGIAPKSLNTNILNVKGIWYSTLLILSVGVIPLIAFSMAFIVWIRRRHL